MRLTLFLLKYEGELNWPPRKTALKNPSLIIVRIKKLSSPTQVFVEDESVTFLINSKLVQQWPTLQQQKALSVYYQNVYSKSISKIFLYYQMYALSKVSTIKSKHESSNQKLSWILLLNSNAKNWKKKPIDMLNKHDETVYLFNIY